MVETPGDDLDIENTKSFLALGVAITEVGPGVISVAARPAYGDGVVSQWLEYLCREEGYEHGPVETLRIGSLEGVYCDAMQEGDGIVMKMRLALVEDGGRLYQMSAMAPASLWSAFEERFAVVLGSLEIAQPSGQTAQLFIVESSEEVETPVSNTAETTARLTEEEWAELVLAEDAESLNPENPFNVRLRDNGAGLTPRTLSVDAASRSAQIGLGAIESVVRIPFGWHAMDDGRRALIFDADGRIQISLSIRGLEDSTIGELPAACFADLVAQQPNLNVEEFEADGVHLALVRDANFDGETLCQSFMACGARRDGYAFVARVTATSDDMRIAMNLAGSIMESLERNRGLFAR